MVLMFCAQWTENDKQTEQQCPTVPSWDPAQRDLSHRSFPQSLSIMLLLFSSCRESPNNFLPIVWQTWLCAVSGCHQSAVTMDRHRRTLAAADHRVPADTAEPAEGYLSPPPLLHVTQNNWIQNYTCTSGIQHAMCLLYNTLTTGYFESLSF